MEEDPLNKDFLKKIGLWMGGGSGIIGSNELVRLTPVAGLICSGKKSRFHRILLRIVRS